MSFANYQHMCPLFSPDISCETLKQYTELGDINKSSNYEEIHSY